MATAEVKAAMIPLSKVVADPHQPRKEFDETKLNGLRVSVKKYGIQEPLKVEFQRDGTFLLIDGERRLRVAQELKLKEVPVIVKKPESDTDRLLLQFQLQEMHEPWTPTEKAIAVFKLSENLGVNIASLADVLGIPRTTVRRYIGFANLIEKKEFQKMNIDIEYASYINSLKNYVKRHLQDEGKKFDRDISSEVELAIMKRIRNGVIQKKFDVTKIQDSLKADFGILGKVIKNTEWTPDEMFYETHAAPIRFVRNAKITADYMIGNLNKVISHCSSKEMSDEFVASLKTLSKKINEALALK